MYSTWPWRLITARKLRAGELVDEFSSLIDLRPRTSGFPVGAVALIAVGVLLLLNTLNILSFRYIVRYWPVLLIAIGVYMLYARVAAGRQEVPGERP